MAPSGNNSLASRSYQMSELYSVNRFATCSMIAWSAKASPQAVQWNAVMGTPQERCREMHQSGLFSTIP